MSKTRSVGIMSPVAPSRLRHGVAVVAMALIGALLICAIAPDLVAAHDPLRQSLQDTLLPPGSRSSEGSLHLLGTDSLGRDIFSRLVYGAQFSLGVGVSGMLLSAAIGIPLGILAGYRGGAVDAVIMRVVDGLLSFPNLVLYIFLRFVIGGGVLQLIIVLSVVRWVTYVRLARSVTLPYRNIAFVEAARMIGCSRSRIIFRHILPNVIGPLSVLATLEVAALILAESALSFLGLGVQPPAASWGQMIAEGSRYLSNSPWLIMLPGAVIFVATLSLNFLGQEIRERYWREGPAR